MCCFVGIGACMGAAGCSKDKSLPARLDTFNPGSGNKDDIGSGYPVEGSSCTEEGGTTECGTVEERVGDDIVCRVGVSTCTDGAWGPCEGTSKALVYWPPDRSLRRLQGLADAADDCDNACDPDCRTFTDTPDGVETPDGLTADPTGISVVPTGSLGGGSCSDIVVAASPDTITVTAYSGSAITTSPAKLTFVATCGAGGPAISPTWSIDGTDANYAHIDSATGEFTVYSPVAKDMTVTARSAVGTGSGTAHVLVNIATTDGGSCSTTTIQNLFQNAPTGGADPGTILYPYPIASRPVVFPLSLTAPLLQWNTGGTTASCVRVSLRYPSGSSSPTFFWSKLSSGEPKGPIDATQPAFALEQTAWNYFSATARASDGDIILQRRSSTTSKVMDPEIAKVHFANDALRGTVYYTEYKSWFRPPYVTGGQSSINTSTYPITQASTGRLASTSTVCPVGNSTHPSATGSYVRSLDLSTPGSTPVDAFSGSGGCPVCHSVSPDGKMLVTTGNVWQSIATAGGSSVGMNVIGAGATVTPVADVPQYSFPWDTWSQMSSSPFNTEPVEDSRGWAYGAMSPTGRYVLQGPNYWGNTMGTVVGNNTQDASYTGSNKRFFVADTSLVKPAVRFATRVALPSNTAPDAKTLKASANGTLVVGSVDSNDTGTLNTNDTILVKNESDATKNGIYTVTSRGSSSSKWLLTRRSDADGTGEMAANQLFRVDSTRIYNQTNSGTTANNLPVYYRIVTTGSIVPGTTNINFAQWSTVRAATTAALPGGTPTLSGSTLTSASNAAITTAVTDGVPVVTGMGILVKNQANPAHNGIYTISTVGSSFSRWVLARRVDFNESVEVTNGAQVRVTEGTDNGGLTFELATPNPITLNSTGLTFSPLAGDDTLRSTTMMTPAFSPDGSKLVYVNGDRDTIGANQTGWRRGLSVLDVNPETMAFSNKRRLVNNYNPSTPGPTIKWPFFEPDNKSVVYVESSPTEYCPAEAGTGYCTNATCTSTGGFWPAVDTDIERACFEAVYGNMSPTTRSYWPGSLKSVNADSPSTPVELAWLNDAVDSGDADKAYQPTVLPFAAGGYRWVIFTSQRSYGNQFNALGTHFTCASALLWMAALDDVPAGATDRSHPAFLVPGQAVRSITSDSTYAEHYISERGYLVPSPCTPLGGSCEVNEECCGSSDPAPNTAACRIDIPATFPLTRHCVIPPICSPSGGSCSTDDDCCAGTPCIDGQCTSPPTYSAATFTRDYDITCEQGYHVAWGDFVWHATIPDSGVGSPQLVISVQSSDTTDFTEARRVDLETSTRLNSNPPPLEALAVDVGAALTAASVPNYTHLRVTVEFVPSTDGLFTPTLNDWELSYSCIPAE